MSKKTEDPVQFVPSKSAEFAAEDAKLEDLKKSSSVEDQLVVVLMEPHVEEGETDAIGLYHVFATMKAKEILKRFNVSVREIE